MAIIGAKKARAAVKVKSTALNLERRSAKSASFFPFGEQLLSAAWILHVCRNSGHTWRRRQWTPVVTFWACILKQLHSGAGARFLEHLAYFKSFCTGEGARDGADFCRARFRLPSELFRAALLKLDRCFPPGAARCFNGLRVVFVDGLVLRTPRTRANQQAFSTGQNERGPSQWPLVRALLLVCAGSGTILDVIVDGYQNSERKFFRQMLQRLEPGLLLVGDRGFCSCIALWFIRKRGGHMLCRLHQSRRRQTWQAIGPRDFISRWPKKELRYTRSREWRELTDQVEHDLWIRIIERTVFRKGYRAVKIALVTTLLDPKKYPADDLVKLYFERWNIECDFRTLKADYGIKQLSAKTPTAVRNELLSAAVAITIVCLEKANAGDGQARRLSSRTTLKLILTVAEMATYASVPRARELRQKLLKELRLTAQPLQQRPPEPRAVVQHHRRYPSLSTSRPQWRDDYLRELA